MEKKGGYGSEEGPASTSIPKLVDRSKKIRSSLKSFGLINASRSVLFPKNSYSVNSIEEWQDIILTELKKTNDILINTKT